jgi:putative transcriptional regulator
MSEGGLKGRDARISEKILEFKAKNRISQEELAKLIGVKHSTVSRLINGHRRFSMKHLQNIAQAMGIDLEELLRGEKEKYPMVRIRSGQRFLVMDRDIEKETKEI